MDCVETYQVKNMKITKAVIESAKKLAPYELEGDNLEFAEWIIENYGDYQLLFMGPISRKAKTVLNYSPQDVFDLWSENAEAGAWLIHTVDQEHSDSGHKYTVGILNIRHPQIHALLTKHHPDVFTKGFIMPDPPAKREKADSEEDAEPVYRKPLKPVKV